MTAITGSRTEIAMEEGAYPELLQRVADAPRTLYVAGDASMLSLPMVAIAGARKATPYGIACASRFAAIAAGRGACIVTGGALGIATAAMEAALDAGGTCVVVLAQGLDVDAYPAANADLFRHIVEGGGAIVSEQPWGRPPLPWMFRARNRIVTGLASCLLVCEAGLPSGTFSAADGALAQGRPVFAVPGRIDEPQSLGCNLLIASGAAPVVSEAAFEDMLMRAGL